MAENRKLHFEPLFTAGNVTSIVFTVLAAAGVIYSMQGDTKAHAQRIAEVEKKIEKGEARDDETARTLGDLKGAVIELRGDLRNQGRQLERIEQLLQQRAMPAAPRETPPAAPRDPITVYPPR